MRLHRGEEYPSQLPAAAPAAGPGEPRPSCSRGLVEMRIDEEISHTGGESPERPQGPTPEFAFHQAPMTGSASLRVLSGSPAAANSKAVSLLKMSSRSLPDSPDRFSHSAV